MNVLSLFDGMSCGRIALERAGIPVINYYASEIDKHCIKVTQHHYPDTIQLGDIKSIKSTDLPKIDLIIGGSPCQGFSFSGKQLNFNDPRSALFFEFVRLVKECKPKYWLLENVVMKQEYQDVISELLGCCPTKINSSLVSAQNRVRLYWANFPIYVPEDRNILIHDIIDGFYLNKASIIGRRINSEGVRQDYNKSLPIRQCLEVRSNNPYKSNCLTTVDKDNVLTSMPYGRYPDAFKKMLDFRYYTVNECCRLQTVPDNYFRGIVSDSQAKKILGNGWTVDLIAYIFKKGLV